MSAEERGDLIDACKVGGLRLLLDLQRKGLIERGQELCLDFDFLQGFAERGKTDRFAMHLRLDGPMTEEEREAMKRSLPDGECGLKTVASARMRKEARA